jgi:hypothetical protein
MTFDMRDSVCMLVPLCCTTPWPFDLAKCVQLYCSCCQGLSPVSQRCQLVAAGFLATAYGCIGCRDDRFDSKQLQGVMHECPQPAGGKQLPLSEMDRYALSEVTLVSPGLACCLVLR